MLSVVIPTLNEAARIAAAVANVASLPEVGEVIVVDGNSSDDTGAIARRAGATVIESERGRGRQLNAGAAASSGDVLLFLHADVTLPPNATAMVLSTLARPGVVGGAFRTWHRAERWKGTPKAALLHLADFRSRYSPLPYGDQAMFTTRVAFELAGGFPEMALMEDLAFARALRKQGRLARLRASVSVSGRRFESAPFYQTALVNLFPLLFYIGVPSSFLARLYGNPR